MLVEKSWDSLTITSVDFPLVMEELKKTCRLIQSKHPEVEKILLFGSFARGDYTPDSDLDLLFIVNKTSDTFINRPMRYLPYFSEFPFDMNAIIYTLDEIEIMKKESNPFLLEALKEGIEIKFSRICKRDNPREKSQDAVK